MAPMDTIEVVRAMLCGRCARPLTSHEQGRSQAGWRVVRQLSTDARPSCARRYYSRSRNMGCSRPGSGYLREERLKWTRAPGIPEFMSSDLSAYLDLDAPQAQGQWIRILARQPRPRQEPFLPVEVILCNALFRVLDPHRFGGSNIRLIPDAVKVLAHTLKRTTGSLTSKMLNLDGSRENAGRLEPEVFLRFAQEPDRFVALYLVTIQAARDVGLGAERVPDLVEGLELRDVPLLGQHELGRREIERLFDEQKDELQRLGDAFAFNEPDTSRIVEQRVRLGQHRFASAVLRHYDHRCAFCGFAPKHLLRHRLLVASHIKPWADSSPKERLDPRNGIAACPMHDSAFDSGLITVNGGMRIHRADLLDISIVSDVKVGYYFEEPGLQARLLIPEGRKGPADVYLQFHRERRFRGKAEWEMANVGLPKPRRRRTGYLAG